MMRRTGASLFCLISSYTTENIVTRQVKLLMKSSRATIGFVLYYDSGEI